MFSRGVISWEAEHVSSTTQESPTTRLTLHDGKKAVFEGSSHKPLALAQLLWRYGLGPLRLNHWVEGFLRSFQEIYQLQKASESFTLPSRLLAALDPAFASMLSTRLRDAMLEKGFSGKMLEELVQGMVRINYGQGLDVGAFVGAVALCGFVGPLWAVKGGNHLIAEKLLDSSSARWIRGKVLRIARSSDASRYRVEAKLSGAEHWEEDYDLVFLAAPQYDSELEIIVASKEKLTIARKYQQIFATFFRVPPTSSSLACTDPPGGTILSTAGGNFNSLGQYDTTSGSGPQIWKSFSNSPLDVDSEKALFPEKPQETYAWWAYPVYDTEDERGREIPFCLDDHGLFYCNAIEAAASAMEMAVIGAKNCVLLAKNRLKGLTEKIDKTRSKL